MSYSSKTLGITESAFVILRDLILEKTGLYFENGKKDIFVDKLSDRVIENGFNSFLDYYFKLKYDNNSEEEWSSLMDSLTVNETYFWRESDQFNVLINHCIPEYFSTFQQSPFSIMSAACSSGEEPYSIAIAINEENYFKKFQFDIFAFDGSKQILNKAKSGTYKERSFRNLPDYIKHKYFQKNNNDWKLNDEILSKVKFNFFNLMNINEMKFNSVFNVIFCRNVFIYFSDEGIKKVVDYFYDMLLKPGYLFIGVSESLLKYRTKFELKEINKVFVYVKE